LLKQLRDHEGLARSRRPEQRLMPMALTNTLNQLGNRFGLITAGLEW
jgi:hypothetical protein